MQALSSTGQLGAPGRITIVDRGPMLLGQFSNKAHDYAMSKLIEAGADVKVATGVAAVHPDHVEFDDGSTVAAQTVVWGGGESASIIAQAAGPTPRGGRLDVLPDLKVDGFPRCGRRRREHPLSDDGAPLPQLGSVAQQSGRWAAEHTARASR